MGVGAHFHQGCPTCGRTLQVKVQYLGRDVSCVHCQARFQAADSTDPAHKLHKSLASAENLRRADELLNSFDGDTA